MPWDSKIGVKQPQKMIIIHGLRFVRENLRQHAVLFVSDALKSPLQNAVRISHVGSVAVKFSV